MSGTREGGLKARDTIRQRNPGHYSTIGKVGGKKGNPKTKRDMAATRALNRILRKMTRVDLPDAESLSPSDLIDISPERAALPPAQFVAETPKQRTPKAPKAEPTPEPAKPAEAEVETAKAENRARWAAVGFKEFVH